MQTTKKYSEDLNGSNPLDQCAPSERLPEGKLKFGDASPGSHLEKIPTWFDLELARKGQKFAIERLYGTFYAHLIALCYLFAQRDPRKILYYTQKSHTEEKALHRYLATLLQVKLWYESEITDDPSCPFFTSLKHVRQIHRKMGERVQSENPDFNRDVVEPRDEDEDEGSSKLGRLWKAFKSDMDASELATRGYGKLRENPKGFFYFSQYDMTLTQWSFVALPILYSQQLHIEGVTEEELFGFIHLWAIIAHTLGLEPQYNICLVPDLNSFRVHANWIYENEYLPGFFNVNYESEVMWTALASGVSNIFPFLTVDNLLQHTLEDFIGIPCPKVREQTSWTTFFRRLFRKSIVEPLLHYKWFQQYCNNYVSMRIAKITEILMGLNSRNHEEISRRAFY